MKRKCQVIFFPTFYSPDMETRLKLAELHAEMLFCTNLIANDCKGDRYEEICRVENLAAHLREKWKIIDGGLCDKVEDKDSVAVSSAK